MEEHCFFMLRKISAEKDRHFEKRQSATLKRDGQYVYMGNTGISIVAISKSQMLQLY